MMRGRGKGAGDNVRRSRFLPPLIYLINRTKALKSIMVRVSEVLKIRF